MLINKYITATILAAVSGGIANGQAQRAMPRLVVNITIDQLRTDYIEAFSQYYSENGFRKFLKEGVVYYNPRFSFRPVDRASATAGIVTGTSPSNNGITGRQWLDKASLVPVECTYDNDFKGIFTDECASPQKILTTTIGDELKMATEGKAIVYSIAKLRDEAIIGGGHEADGAFWYNPDKNCWCTSKYYASKAPKWVEDYNLLKIKDFNDENENMNVTDFALECINTTEIGRDDVPDMLYLTYNASLPTQKGNVDKQKVQNKYIQLDREIGRLTSKIESLTGKSGVMIIITGTGYCEEPEPDRKKYRVPGGTFYVNRTSNLLNMYLSAIYGQDKYVESCFYNQIFLNLKQIELKRLDMGEIMERSRSFLIQNSGVRNAFTSNDLMLGGDNRDSELQNWYNSDRCGDLVVEVYPGWKVLNEDNKQQYNYNENIIPFPIIFYGNGIVNDRISAPVTMDRIAPTIAKAIRIRAPNGCPKAPLL